MDHQQYKTVKSFWSLLATAMFVLSAVWRFGLYLSGYFFWWVDLVFLCVVNWVFRCGFYKMPVSLLSFHKSYRVLSSQGKYGALPEMQAPDLLRLTAKQIAKYVAPSRP